MNRKTGHAAALLVVGTLLTSISPAAWADDSTVKQLAQVVINLNHQPSAQDKALLRNIAEGGSAAERTIANALLEMNHKVSPAAKDKLRAISKDSAEAENIRELAAIISGLNHQASAQDMEKLKGM